MVFLLDVLARLLLKFRFRIPPGNSLDILPRIMFSWNSFIDSFLYSPWDSSSYNSPRDFPGVSFQYPSRDPMRGFFENFL